MHECRQRVNYEQFGINLFDSSLNDGNVPRYRDNVLVALQRRYGKNSSEVGLGSFQAWAYRVAQPIFGIEDYHPTKKVKGFKGVKRFNLVKGVMGHGSSCRHPSRQIHRDCTLPPIGVAFQEGELPKRDSSLPQPSNLF